jgi:hypothetical protein
MVSPVRRHVLALVLGTSVAACSFIFELEPSTQALVGADGASDAPAPVTDGPDPTVPDVAPRPPPPPFCESRAQPTVFCADFDDEPAPQPSIVGEARTRDGRIALVSAVSLSPARSLSTIVSAPDGSAALVRALEGTPDGLTVSFDMLISSLQATSIQLTQIELRTGDSSCVIRLFGGATWSIAQSCTLEAGAPTSVITDTPRAVEQKGWHRYAMSIAFTPTKKVTFDVDNVRVVDVAALDAMNPAPTFVTFGIDSATGGSAVVFEDNLVITSP